VCPHARAATTRPFIMRSRMNRFNLDTKGADKRDPRSIVPARERGAIRALCVRAPGPDLIERSTLAQLASAQWPVLPGLLVEKKTGWA